MCYTKLRFIKLKQSEPPQSSGAVPLNDTFKTSEPAKYEQTIFRALLGQFYKKETYIWYINLFSCTNDAAVYEWHLLELQHENPAS